MPQETTGGCSPMPRKVRVASAPMYAPSVIVATTMTGASELGMMCRRMMRGPLAPIARAAWM